MVIVVYCPLEGLPIGFLDGLMSSPFMLPGLLVGGLVPGPWLETGERMGDGDLFMADADSDVRPTMCMLSRDDMEGRWWPLCSD